MQAYKKNDVNLSLEARKVKDLDAATRDWIVDLMERNLKEVIDMVSANSEQIDHRWAIERFVFFDKNIFTVTEKIIAASVRVLLVRL